MQNVSANNVYIGGTGGTVANGIRLLSGQSATLTHAGAVWGIASAASSDVRYMEETI